MIGCDKCHNLIDGRSPLRQYGYKKYRAMIHRYMECSICHNQFITEEIFDQILTEGIESTKELREVRFLNYKLRKDKITRYKIEPKKTITYRYWITLDTGIKFRTKEIKSSVVNRRYRSSRGFLKKNTRQKESLFEQ